MAHIHPTALVDPQAEIDSDVEIGPYCIVEKGTQIGAGSKLYAHVMIKSGTILCGENQVDAFSVLGGVPQDFSFSPLTPTQLVIGKGTVIREGVILHRATREEEPTRIGEHCFLMNHAHIAHDVQMGNRVIFTGGAMSAGFVKIGDYAVIGGGAVIHQFSRVGEGAMIGGAARISRDIPPFVMVSERNEISGLNLVGLRRRKFPREVIAELKTCFQETLLKGGNLSVSATELLKSGTIRHPESLRFLEFLTERGRPFAHVRKKGDHE